MSALESVGPMTCSGATGGGPATGATSARLDDALVVLDPERRQPPAVVQDGRPQHAQSHPRSGLAGGTAEAHRLGAREGGPGRGRAGGAAAAS